MPRKYAQLEWTIDNVKNCHSHMTTEECEDFLETIEESLKDALTVYGYDFISMKLHEMTIKVLDIDAGYCRMKYLARSKV